MILQIGLINVFQSPLKMAVFSICVFERFVKSDYSNGRQF